MDRAYGIDLQLLPGLAAYDATSADLKTRPVIRGRGPRATDRTDLVLVDGRENVAQALLLRLLTPRGALADLGHSEYGSRLHELIGRNKTPALRNLCRAFVLEAIAQEPRVEPKAVALEFDVSSEGPSDLRFTVAVRPRAGGDPISVTVEVGL